MVGQLIQESQVRSSPTHRNSRYSREKNLQRFGRPFAIETLILGNAASFEQFLQSVLEGSDVFSLQTV
jgi:hypothetical protein